MKTIKIKNEIIKILWRNSMFNKGVINEHSYEDMATEIVDTVAKNLHKPPVIGSLPITEVENCEDCNNLPDRCFMHSSKQAMTYN